MSNFNTSFNLQKNLLNITVPRIKTIKYSLSHLLSNTVSLEILVRISNFMQITDTHCNSKKKAVTFPSSMLFQKFSQTFPCIPWLHQKIALFQGFPGSVATLTSANEFLLEESTTAVDPRHLKVKDTELDWQSNRNLLHHYHHAKTQLNSLLK